MISSLVSIDQRMRKCVLIPDSIPIKDIDLSCHHISKHHLVIKSVDTPEKFSVHFLGINLLKILNINIVSLDQSKGSSLMEYHLLSVRQELCMGSEILRMQILSWCSH